MRIPVTILALVLTALGSATYAEDGTAAQTATKPTATKPTATKPTATKQTMSQAAEAERHNLPADFSALIRTRLPSVATVTPMTGSRTAQGALSGTGFLVGTEGDVIVPATLVENSERVEITFADGKSVEGSIAALDRESGIAVVRISGQEDLPSLRWGSSKDLELGNWLVAIGRPNEGMPTATVGIVEALSDNFISTGMTIEPENIGSPVLNGRGQVVGITTLVRGPTGAPGSAIIASDRLRAAIERLAQADAQGREPARLGVVVQQLDSGLAKAFGIEPGAGVVVTSVEPGSAAAKAGVRPGDIITGFAGNKVEAPDQLRRLIERAGSEQGQELKLLREGQSKTLAVTLDRGGQARSAAKMPRATEETPSQQASGRLGLRLLPLNPDLAKELGLSEINDGVVVVAVKNDAPADAAGIQPGDVIVAVGQRLVKGVDDVVSELEEIRESGKDSVALLVYRDGNYQYVSVTV